MLEIVRGGCIVIVLVRSARIYFRFGISALEEWTLYQAASDFEIVQVQLHFQVSH